MPGATLLSFVAEIDPIREKDLDRALATLREAVEQSPHPPFAALPSLHFASVVRIQTDGFAPVLVFEHNFDGPFDVYLADLLRVAGAEVHSLFRCCRGYTAVGAHEPATIARYLRRHVVHAAATHVGNPGLTCARVVEENALRERVARQLDAQIARDGRPETVDEAYDAVCEAARSDESPSTEVPPPREAAAELWRRRARVVAVAAAALAIVAVVGVLAGVIAWRMSHDRTITAVAVLAVLLGPPAALVALLRSQERHDPTLVPDVPPERDVTRLLDREDRQLQNHLASVTLVKPGALRQLTLRGVLRLLNLTARWTTSGALRGLTSIHFAHWALLDGGRRLLFLSNYDGSWGSYLDDFIRKASPGLSAIWSNTTGFPRTRFLVRDGARDGHAFRSFARAHQFPAAVWYSAYRNLTVQQIETHAVLRGGIATRPAEDALPAWLRRW